MDSTHRPIRVTIVHRGLAKYRIPVFRELARRPGIELRVAYGSVPALSDVAPDGFEALQVSRWEVAIGNHLLVCQPSEWTYCSRRYSDVVILSWAPGSLTLLPALLRARFTGLPTVLWGHGYSKHGGGLHHRARNWLATRSSAVVFYEPSMRESLIREGWDPGRLFVALNSIDNTEIEQAREWWCTHPEALAEFRRKQGLDAGPVILFVSRLSPANRLDWLIQATLHVAADFPSVKIAIIGDGVTERERLESLVESAGAANNVIFRDGIYDEMELAPWFLTADVFCYPANIGLSLLHALWYGLPVVTSNNRAMQNPEIFALKQGVNGLTYEHGSAASLADSLNQIIADPSLRESMSRAARLSVEGRFTIPKMVDGLEAAIRYAHESTASAEGGRLSVCPPSRA